MNSNSPSSLPLSEVAKQQYTQTLESFSAQLKQNRETRDKEGEMASAPTEMGDSAAAATTTRPSSMLSTAEIEYEGGSSSNCCLNPFGRRVKRLKPNNYYVGDGGGGGTNVVDLAHDMNTLTVEEREKVYDDVHGVSETQNESPEFINTCMQKLNESLSMASASTRKYYARAVFLWPALEEGKEGEEERKFKLMFLRADEYNSQKAAQRIMKYFEEKHRLFGEQLLVKPVTVNDLDDEAIEILKSGFISDAGKDRTGRSVFYVDMKLMRVGKWHPDNVIRCFWYAFMNFFYSDEINQKKGLSVVNMAHVQAHLKIANLIHVKLSKRARWGYLTGYCLPGRCSSLHLCYDDHRMDFFVQIIRSGLGRRHNLRLRTHLGSDLENEYALRSFGICVQARSQGTDSRASRHDDYVRRRIEADKQLDENSYQEGMRRGSVPYPGRKDVLIGRGKPYRDFPGNVIWYQIINGFVDRYREADSRFDRTVVAMDAASTLQISGVRFLLEKITTDGSVGWKVLNEKDIQEKVSVSLQNQNRAKRQLHGRKARLAGAAATAVPR